MNCTQLLTGLSLSLVLTGVASAQIARFQWLTETFSADDLTPDGKYVVGSYNGGGGYIWSCESGYTQVGGLSAVAVSDDGTIVLGSIDDGVAPGNVAGLWNAEDGWVSLGTLPDAGMCPSSSSPYELSADGSVAVGLGWQDGCSARGFRWTAEDGMLGMEPLANRSNRASVVSADGNLLGGFAQGSFSRTPAIWLADGTGQLLDPPDGDVLGEVLGINDAGTALLGEWDGKGFVLREGEPLELFSGVIEAWTALAYDIADDGTIVGFDIFQLARQAWIRPNGGPAVNLLLYLQDLGMSVVGGDPPVFLEVVQAISTSGNIIIGHNAFSNGFIINLCVPDINNDGDVNVTDLVAVITAWGSDDCTADTNLDGTVNVTDLVAVITAWGPCP